ncbi:hypothetical protein [Streptomyces sp. KHY 26]|uniref:hypothetical protein n=1 Tax=Streptomyces sp. KHY 26 TaxID=3097359 RepID=UPI00376ED0DC
MRVGLLLGLVVLITAHLAGTVHSSAFTGPHVGGLADRFEISAHDSQDGPGPPPGHEHEMDGHTDHAVDRPRAAADDAVGKPEHDASALVPAAAPCPAGPAIRCPNGIARAPDGPSTLTLHCVRRQ